MILVTIGTMLPFDRLVRAADAWAAEHPDIDVLAQIGEQAGYEPRHMRWIRLLPPDAFAAEVERSRLLVAHAGTGSYFLAAERQRTLVVFPRRAAFREHTTDHQVRTAEWLFDKPGVHVAMVEADLPGAIAAGLSAASKPTERLPPHAPRGFTERVRRALLA